MVQRVGSMLYISFTSSHHALRWVSSATERLGNLLSLEFKIYLLHSLSQKATGFLNKNEGANKEKERRSNTEGRLKESPRVFGERKAWDNSARG